MKSPLNLLDLFTAPNFISTKIHYSVSFKQFANLPLDSTSLRAEPVNFVSEPLTENWVNGRWSIKVLSE